MLFLAPLAKAQDAKVIVVDPQDAKKAASIYAEKLAADKEWNDFLYRMNIKYIKDSHDWSYGILFSSDFKAIIPADYKPDPCSKFKYPFGGSLTLTGVTNANAN
jgi:hypothetical protein